MVGMKDGVSVPQSLWHLPGLVTISWVCSHPMGWEKGPGGTSTQALSSLPPGLGGCGSGCVRLPLPLCHPHPAQQVRAPVQVWH